MNTQMKNRLLGEFLSYLERKEHKLLVWGIVDGAFGMNDLLTYATEFIEQTGKETPSLVTNVEPYFTQPKTLVDDLVSSTFLFAIPNKLGRYRTRMAEGMRLFQELRQLFPGQDWNYAPKLVTDFRLEIRPRMYPTRDIPLSTIYQNEKLLPPGHFRRRIVQAILQGGSDDIKLSDFQIDALFRILEQDNNHTSTGTIVCAGTGSGKTLAFYLPSFILIAEKMTKGVFWTQCIALYPRNELLKDQLMTAYQEARKLDNILLETVQKKLRIGALFGDVPDKPAASQKQWTPHKNANGIIGYICPFLVCPKCDAPVYWKKEDITTSTENLQCTKSSCTGKLKHDEIVITRNRLNTEPPEILFTSTEMINRNLSNTNRFWGRKVLGCVVKPPHLVLLDEVHTYVGLNGAQIAYLLRRWKHWTQSTCQFIGLSATLREAKSFFAELTNIPEDSVTLIEPTTLVAEGQEYLLALRGDPISETSLLSTTIQSAMLLRRLLQPASNSHFLAGQKLFVFTDDLDVTNRLYDNLKDAENTAKSPKFGSLANIRSTKNQKNIDAYDAGQRWDLIETVGHSLSNGSKGTVGRTSSQDKGVDSNAEIIVATASLEVGYNDKLVGGVIQHKSPRDNAQFLQRKGRAGRERTMRPWTVVILSDFGRDRLTYQNYNALLDPQLHKRSLPTQNRYVLRMQATYALIDWLAIQKDIPTGTLWTILSNRPAPDSYTKNAQSKISTLLREILNKDSMQKKLQADIEKSLGLPHNGLEDIMWRPPRSLMLEVIPTLLRRLETSWSDISAATKKEPCSTQPLPEYIPSNLFSDLCLPEVQINIPTQENDTFLPVAQAMGQLSVGRVSKRFITQQNLAHWIAPPSTPGFGPHKMDVQPFTTDSLHFLGTYPIQGKNIDIYFPQQFTLTQVPSAVNPTSNAMPIWTEFFATHRQGESISIIPNDPWNSIFDTITAYVHQNNNPVDVYRMSLGSNITTKYTAKDTPDHNMRVLYQKDNKDIALGFTNTVDALRVTVPIPEDLVSKTAKNRETMHALRILYVVDRIKQDTELDQLANSFQRDWLILGYISVVAGTAIKNNCDLQHAQSIVEKNLAQNIEKALTSLFKFSEPDPDPSSRIGVIKQLAENSIIKNKLHVVANALHTIPPDWKQWLSKLYIQTIGAGFLEACVQFCPQLNMEDLVLDIHPNSNVDTDDMNCFWLSEQSSGGVGLIESFLAAYKKKPNQFFQCLHKAFGPSELEESSSSLHKTLGLIFSDADCKERTEAVVQAKSNGTYADIFNSSKELYAYLEKKNIPLSSHFRSSVHMRLLRSGMQTKQFKRILDIITKRTEEENRLGIEINNQLWSYMFAEGTGNEREKSIQRIYSILWPYGYEFRQANLPCGNRFAGRKITERLLIAPFLEITWNTVNITQTDWREQSIALLQEKKRVCISADQNIHDIYDFLLQSVDMGLIIQYPAISHIKKEADSTLYYLEL